MAGLTFTINSRFKEGKYTKVIGTIAWDSSYPTNGESFSDGLGSNVLELDCKHYAGYSFQPDYTNKKIKAYYADYSSGTDGALIEVANTTDLSGLTAAPFSALLRHT